jgi:hypothetical protein
MTNDNATRAALQQLIKDDAVGQLRRCEGLMATLGSENGALKLDWVEGIARLLTDPVQLEEVEAEAQNIWQRGIRHLIWAGMGGSVIAVRVLCDLGFCRSSDNGQVTIYPPYLVSLRMVARNSEACLLGSYTNFFLHAQAVSTWQAMMEAGRPCFLLVIDGSLGDALEPLATFFSQVEEYLHHA